MIIVRLIGRLGNQLFQYSAALAAQKRLNTYAVIDDRDQKDIVAQYFTVKGIRQHPLIKRLAYKFARYQQVAQTGLEDPTAFVETNVANNRYYLAYFQSEAYFSNIKRDLKKRIRVKKRFVEEFRQKYGELFDKHKILAIHYRFGDYVNWTIEELGVTNMTLPDTYYKNALAAIEDRDDYLVVLVTDDIGLCKQKTEFVSHKLVVSESEILDFQLLLNADKLIVANSSFSWWAAYLNNKNAQVYAPKYWLGFKVGREFPNGIIPDRYIQVEF